MRRVWVESLSADGPFDVGADEARHLRDVLRVAPGDALVLFDADGRERSVRVGSVTRKGVRVEPAGDVVAAPPRRGPHVTLLVALLKGEAMDRVVRATTELGVAAIVPVLAARSVPEPREERTAKRLARWARIAREAARQSERSWIPRIEEPRLFADAVAALAPGRRILLWEEERGRFLAADVAAAPAAAWTLAIGPEGGWTREEVAGLVAAGFEPRALSDAILRAETAAIAAVSIARGGGSGGLAAE